MKPEELLTKSKEELVADIEKFNDLYDEIKANLVMIRSELLERLEEENKDGEIIGEYQIRKAKRNVFKTNLEQAEELGAVKRVPDTKVLGSLVKKGVEVPGHSTTVYLTVRRVPQEDA